VIKLKKIYSQWETIFCLSILLFFGVFVLIQEKPIFWDESWYRDMVFLFELSDSFSSYLDNVKGGPLYGVVQYYFGLILPDSQKGIRSINLILTALIIVSNYYLLRMLDDIHPLKNALKVVRIPIIFVLSGLALSELPALFFLTLALLSLVFAKQKNNNLFYAISGLCFGIACAGRQPILVSIIGFYYFMFSADNIQLSINRILTFSLGVFLTFGLLVIKWNGLLPPNTPLIGAKVLAFDHLLLSFCYAAFILFLLSDNWFSFLRKFNSWGLLALFVICALLNYRFGFVDYLPMKGLVMHYCQDCVLPIKLIFGGFVLTLAVSNVSAFAYNFYSHRKDKLYALAVIGSFLVLLTPIVISEQFSSRYVGQAIPFLLIISRNQFESNTLISLVKILISFALGMISLASYFDYF